MNEPLSAEHLDPYQYRKILMPLDGSKRAEYVIGAVRPFLGQAELVGVQAENHANNGTGEQTEVGAMADYGVVGEQSGCLCIVPHVVCRPELPRQTQPTHEEVEAVERLVEYNQRAAMHYLEQLSEQIGCPIESRLLAGTNAATALHRLAEEEAVDLVVLCAHGYGGDPQWPYGSVTTNFISYSDIPLLIVQDLRDANTGATIAEESTHQKKGH
jgi:nucleotide-binding universal stress UspA family protein